MTVRCESETQLRRTILDESLKQFFDSGYNRTRVSEIAASLGITAAVIRKFFPTKKDIVKTLFDEERKDFRVQLESLFSGVDPGKREEVAATLKKLFFMINESIFLTMIYRYEDFPVGYCCEMSQSSESVPVGATSLLEKFMQDCQAAGTLRSGDVRLLVHSYRTLLSLVLSEPGLRQESSQSYNLLINIFVDGFLYAPEK